ncbi:hypothetical protein [Herbaspirillum robiniae]|uniref:hypothetical protein n=1 Tax=Herbaspirillum robiniae TaxID=2014887 RepID=UPI0011E4CF7A|nr:hypothetical protein [Herbaspirillum robiniae]
MGKAESLRSTALLIHFFALSGGWSEAGFVIRLAFGIAWLATNSVQAVEQKRSYPTHPDAAGEAFMLFAPLWASRWSAVKNGSARQSSEATLPCPFFMALQREPRSGWHLGAVFFAYFLWRAKESERLPGRPRRSPSTGERKA